MPNYEHMHRKTAGVGPVPEATPPHKMVPPASVPDEHRAKMLDGDNMEERAAAEERVAEAAEDQPNILGVPVPPAGESGPTGL